MTARPQDVALLPLPKYPTDGAGDEDSYNTGWNECLDSCAAALASAQAREEELRAEVEKLWQANIGYAGNEAVLIGRAGAAEVRAEPLAEALREIQDDALRFATADTVGGDLDAMRRAMARLSVKISAALSTNAATQTGETNEAAE